MYIKITQKFELVGYRILELDFIINCCLLNRFVDTYCLACYIALNHTVMCVDCLSVQILVSVLDLSVCLYSTNIIVYPVRMLCNNTVTSLMA